MKSKDKKINITKLKKEIQVKDTIIKELLVFITREKLKLPDYLMNIISILYPVQESKNDNKV